METPKNETEEKQRREIPLITSFVDGLKLFLESVRLRWFTIVFFIGIIVMTLWERIGVYLGGLGLVISLAWGIFPTYFLFALIVSVAGLQRFIVSDESYKDSVIRFVPWIIASGALLFVMLFLFPSVLFMPFSLLYIGVGFIGWIGFQSYFSSRTSLKYARRVTIEERSKLGSVLLGAANIFNYVVIIGGFIFTILFVNPSVIAPPYSGALIFGILGMLLALGFNFLNGLIITRERNKPHAVNIALLSMFVSLYSTYFTYNVLKGFDPSIDWVSLGITVFFTLYTMSSVGQILASRAGLDTRLKVSKETAATLTFFLASSYTFVDTAFTQLAGGIQGATGDIVKLLIFPLVALIMELRFIYRARKAQKEPEEPGDLPVVTPEEEIESKPETETESGFEEESPEEDTMDEELRADENTEGSAEEAGNV
ncbi:MAG: hypothetical protein R6V83_13135 [Candidatus Thorarchaeota archaeon]